MRMAQALPIPKLPPVTTTHFPFSRFMLLLLWDRNLISRLLERMHAPPSEAGDPDQNSTESGSPGAAHIKRRVLQSKPARLADGKQMQVKRIRGGAEILRSILRSLSRRELLMSATVPMEHAAIHVNRRNYVLTKFSYWIRRMNRRLRAHFSLVRLPLLRATTPIVGLEYRTGSATDRLIVFLPGISDLAEDFGHRGFVKALRRHHSATDAIALDAHFGYYSARNILQRLTDDVIASAHAAGYRKLWLVGISMGGFGAACYAARHAGAVEGIVLLAPYLGGGVLAKEIARAGGVRQWHPGHVKDTDYARHLWAWIKAWTEQRPDASGMPKIYLGYGSADRFASANRLLGEVLPEDHVFVVPGGHNWRTWERIWNLFLERWPGN
jgi:pimeloyl-ACP methyl ester carboxylesterase